ncbi:(E,E)-geranyllinalool synthase-like [Dorcoceras hygrometricum]|uniref:(E,E)-geranyllinalool synthase-like n=1 Tax=Dorcoceras hygrometricum TaxID=472368 RepID=A0A2Z7D0N8_9LAMI|nr:(E,E)-geranyllinalool synthase-like [Dorcoceras hygrometricum]
MCIARACILRWQLMYKLSWCPGASWWEGEGLTGHSKTIFDALDGFVNQFAAIFPPHERGKLMANLRNIWSETFTSWMVEKTWSLMGYVPSMDEYLKNANISVSIHAIALPATSGFLNLSSSDGTQNLEYHKITKLLMESARLLNDARSYQREEQEGKMNFVHLHMKQNPSPGACIEDSIAHVQQIVGEKMKEFMEHVFMDTDNSMPKSCRQLHLSCMKSVHMFYNSANNFDCDTALVDDINKAIYLPIRQIPEPETNPELP